MTSYGVIFCDYEWVVSEWEIVGVWVSAWVSVCVNDWVNEWLSKCVSEWVGVQSEWVFSEYNLTGIKKKEKKKKKKENRVAQCIPNPGLCPKQHNFIHQWTRIRSRIRSIQLSENGRKILRPWMGMCNTFAMLNHPILVPHICVSELYKHWPGNGLSPDRRQAITWTNAGSLLIGSLGTNFSEIWIKIRSFSFMKMHLDMPSAKWVPFCPGEMS